MSRTRGPQSIPIVAVAMALLVAACGGSSEDHAGVEDTAKESLATTASTQVLDDSPTSTNESASIEMGMTEVNLDFQLVDLPGDRLPVISTTPSGDFLAAVYDESSAGSELLISSDGLTWSSFGKVPAVVTILQTSGDTWVAAGSDPESLTALSPSRIEPWPLSSRPLVFVSDDQGIIWKEVSLEFEAPTRVDVNPVAVISSLALQGDTILLLGNDRSDIDVASVMLAAGKAVEGDTIIPMFSPDGVRAWVGHQGESTVADVSIDELGLSEAEFMTFMGQSNGNASVLRSVAGAPFEAVELPKSSSAFVVELVTTSDGFGALTIDESQGFKQLNYSSSDGETWFETDAIGSSVGAQGQWAASQFDNGQNQSFLQSFDGGATWVDVPLPDPNAVPQGPVLNSVGLASPWGESAFSSADIGGLSYKESGYTFTWSSPETISVTDSTGATVVEEHFLYGDASENLILGFGGEIWLVDSATSEPLAVVDSNEFGKTLSDAGLSQFGAGNEWVSWSTDGVDWSFDQLEGLVGALWHVHYGQDTILLQATPFGVTFDQTYVAQIPN